MPGAHTFRRSETVIGDLAETYRRAGLALKTLHIGGDEVPEGAWAASPTCRRFMAEHELPDITALRGYFFARLGQILAARSIAMAGWEQAVLDKDEAGARPPGFTAYVWNNGWDTERPDIAEALANAGYDVILGDAAALYLDMAYEKAPTEPGAWWAGFTNLRKVFDFQPFDRFAEAATDAMGQAVEPSRLAGLTRLTAEGRRRIRGIQGALWGETLRSASRVEYLLLPRLIAVAERGWTAAPGRDRRDAAWNGFANRLGQRQLPRLDFFQGGFAYRIPVPGAVVEQGVAQVNVDQG
jgi:hexosaminidase